MNRREFLTRSWAKPRRADIGDGKVLGWIRPPHALAEREFLDTCTRCDACIAACPHDVIFPLSGFAGEEAGGTPALDLMRRGCHLCEGFPCVAACEPGALALPPEAAGGVPVLARASVLRAGCIAWQGPECGACASVCPVPGALKMNAVQAPEIAADICVGCGLCREACVVEPKAISIAPAR